MKKFIILSIVLVALLAVGVKFFFEFKNKEKIILETASITVNDGESFSVDFSRENEDLDTVIEVLTLPAGVTYNSVLNIFTATTGGTYTIVFTTNNPSYPTFSCTVKIADGSQSNPYIISNVTQLLKIGKSIDGIVAWPLTACYQLIKDLDISNIAFYPIGYTSVANGGPILETFSGQFNGNMHIISGLTITENDTENLTSAGLFCSLSTGAKITKLHLTNVNINGSFAYAGAFTGINYGNIERSSAMGDITSTFAGACVGGIAGKNETKIIEESYDGVARIDRVSSTVNIDLTGDALSYAGGITGYNLGGIVINSYSSNNTINIFNESSYIGGISGVNEYIASGTLFLDATIKNTYSSTYLLGQTAESTFAGVVIGTNINHPYAEQGNQTALYVNRISGNYYNNEVNIGLTGIGNLSDYDDEDTEDWYYSYFTVQGKTSTELKDTNSYISYRNNLNTIIYWNFVKVWSINNANNNGFPTLKYTGQTVADDIQTLKLANSIVSISDLNAIRQNLDGDYVLIEELDLTGINWVPIGTKTKPFTGTFYVESEGKIKNLTITNYYEYAGFFGYVGEGAVIDGLIIENVNICSGANAGAIAGAIESAIVTNSAVIGATGNNITESVIETQYVIPVSGYYNVGGLIGYANSSTIGGQDLYEGCYVDNVKIMIPMVNKTVSVGGLVGYTSDTTSVIKCYTKTNITFLVGRSASTSTQYIGGLVGQSNGIIESCYTLAGYVIQNYNILAGYAGGLVGYQTGGIISYSFAEASVTGHYVGGIAGKLSGKLYESYSNNEISAYRGGGLVGFFSMASALIANCYTVSNMYTMDGASEISGIYAVTDSVNYVEYTLVISVMNTSAGGTSYLYTNSSIYSNVTKNASEKNRFSNVVYNDGITYGQGISDKFIINWNELTTGISDEIFVEWTTFNSLSFSDEKWWCISGMYPTLIATIVKDGEMINGSFTSADFDSAKAKVIAAGIDIFNSTTGDIDKTKLIAKIFEITQEFECTNSEIAALFANFIRVHEENVINGMPVLTLTCLNIEYVNETTINSSFIFKADIKRFPVIGGLLVFLNTLPKYMYITISMQATLVGDIITATNVEAHIKKTDRFTEEELMPQLYDLLKVDGYEGLKTLFANNTNSYLKSALEQTNVDIKFTPTGMRVIPLPPIVDPVPEE
ncbi:MAG: GLUG motif-containing protein [Clostridia bacterium]|nr:GLUG motif-containing protein [Clostridia bacterium]